MSCGRDMIEKKNVKRGVKRHSIDQHIHPSTYPSIPEPHSPVGSVADLRTGGRWFDPRLGQYSFRGLMIVIATGFFFSLTAVRCFDNGYVGKQQVAWKEY